MPITTSSSPMRHLTVEGGAEVPPRMTASSLSRRSGPTRGHRPTATGAAHRLRYAGLGVLLRARLVRPLFLPAGTGRGSATSEESSLASCRPSFRGLGYSSRVLLCIPGSSGPDVPDRPRSRPARTPPAWHIGYRLRAQCRPRPTGRWSGRPGYRRPLVGPAALHALVGDQGDGADDGHQRDLTPPPASPALDTTVMGSPEELNRDSG